MDNEQIEKVKKYFNSTVIDYKILWMSSKDLAMHFGYYDDETKTHRESLLKMNEVLSSLVEISQHDRVLDAGCGYGGSAIWLAKNIGCQVVGITVVPFQVKQAAKFVKKNKLSDKVYCRIEDYAHTSFPNNSFSVIWGLESIAHAKSKKDFIKEAFRLLKSDGRILISEYMLRENPTLSENEMNIIDPWLKGWAMPSLLTSSEYKHLLENVGFRNVKIFDLTENVKPSLNRLHKFSKFGMPIAKFFRRLKIFNIEHFGNVEASIYQNKALKLGLWRYLVITASKP